MKRLFLSLPLAAMAWWPLPALSAQAWTAPSQAPLVSRTGGGVAPNVMLTLDVSNSMRFQHMPENQAVVGGFTIGIPIGTQSIRFHPDDNGTQANSTELAIGVIPGQKGSFSYQVNTGNGNGNGRGGGNAGNQTTTVTELPSVLQMMLRSPDVNTIYYNPQVRYLPWLGSDGSRLAAASFRAARVEPMGNSRTLDLSVTSTLLSATWCDGTPTARSCATRDKPFNPALVYRLKTVGGAYLNPAYPDNYVVTDLNDATSTFTRYPARTDCAGPGSCTQAEEQQNFANWFVYYRSRLLLAKAGLGEALMRMDNVMRLGYGRTDKPASTVDGINNLRIVESGVREFTAERRKAVIDWVYGVAASGGTPLRLAMQEVGRYYASPLSTGPWSDTPGTATASAQQACRRAYHVLVTDGYWNDEVNKDGLDPVGNVDGTAGLRLGDGNGKEWQYSPSRPYQDGNANTLADYAMDLWRRDLRPDLDNKVPPSSSNPAFWQSMTNFMLGLGVRGTLDPRTDLPALVAGTRPWTLDQIDDLWHAALNSRGDYFSASDAGQLSAALYAAMRSAIERELVEAGVATASATLEAGNRKYIPRYKTGKWSGDVEAYELNEQGLTTSRLWSARERLPAWDKRNIVTWDPGLAKAQGVSLDWSLVSSAWQGALSPASRNADFINFLRGDRSREDAVSGLRVREQVLGDFINSTPIFLRDAAEPGHASLPDIGAGYLDYVNNVKAKRAGVLYVGANDGMLHGFRDTRDTTPAGASADGVEVFAYVPRAVVPRLPLLSQGTYGTSSLYHQYYVDGPLSEADIHVKPPGGGTSAWRNYLFGTTGAGGRAVFALDVTEPDALGPASVRWEINSANDAELGYVTAPVTYGRLPGGRWVALFGNGYGGESGQAFLFVVDVETGEARRLAVGSANTANGLGGVVVRKSAKGEIEALYAGDLNGNLWRFDYSATDSAGFVVGNDGQALLKAASGQPFVQAPMVYSHAAGGWIIMAATGRLITDDDLASTTVQSVYAVRDKGAGNVPSVVPADLAQRALSIAPTGADGQAYFNLTGDALAWSTKPGWYFNLSLDGYSGLRVTYPLQDLGQRVALVSAVAPVGTVGSCDAVNGKGINLLVPVDTGLPGDKPMFDTNGDGAFNTSDRLVAGYATAADGAERAVRARPPAASGGGGNGTGDTGGSRGGGAAGGCTGLVSLQNATGQTLVCLPPKGKPAVRPIAFRVWSRILKQPF